MRCTLVLLQVVHPGRTELHATQLVPGRGVSAVADAPVRSVDAKFPAVLQTVQTVADVQVLQPVI